MMRILSILALFLWATVRAASGQPVPNTPSDGAIDQPIDVTIGWRPLTSVSAYEAQISLTSSFEEYEQVITSESSAGLANFLYQTTYYWRVQGIDDEGNSLTEWSSVQSFTTKSGAGIPQPILPEDGGVDMPRTVQLTWSAIPGAGGYEVEYAFEPSFQSGIRVSASGTLHTLANLEYAQQIFWHVRLTSAAGGPGEWSRYFSFTTEYAKPDPLDPPRLLSPANNAMDQTTPLVLEWSSVGGADIHYDVEVGFDDAFSDLAHSSQDIDSTTLDLVALESDRTYFWRVRARNSETQSEWSSVFRFATRPDPPSGPLAPQLLTPFNGARLIPVTTLLTWDSIENATWYEIEFGDDPSFAERDTLIRTGSATIEMFELAPETTYHWRARAGNENGPSGWSRPFRFTTAPEEALLPDAPRLLFPADNAADVELSTPLIWLPAPNATSYAVQLSTTGDFNSEVQTFDAIDTTMKLDALAEGTSYYWRAQGRNPFGESEWSEAGSFTTAGSSGVEDEMGHETAVRIYPIPASENLIVEIPDGHGGIAVSLFDARGVLRVEKELESGDEESGRFILPLDGIPAGFWFCRIVLDDAVVTRPVIVIR